MAHAYPKVLYFIAGMAPTPDQIADADNCGPGVAFRNATLIHPDAPIEDCDAVAGDAIPATTPPRCRTFRIVKPSNSVW
jgi:hypothetical protein